MWYCLEMKMTKMWSTFYRNELHTNPEAENRSNVYDDQHGPSKENSMQAIYM